MYHPTTRVLAVLALLQSHRRMRGADLAKRLEVDVRTLRRYIAILQDLGVPIVAERGRYGAYTLASDSYLPPLFLTNDEVMALTVGLLAAKQLGVTEMIPAVESIRAKLEQTMPSALKQRIQEMSETITLDMRSVYAVSLNQVLQMMSSAVQQQRRVQIRYRARDMVETLRTVAPYGVVFYQGVWYAVGYCYLRKALRSFRLDRVQTIELSDQAFEKPNDFDALAYMTKANATLPRRYTFKVALLCDEKMLRQERLNYLGVISHNGDGFMLQGTADDLAWVARELAVLGCSFKVLAPDELKTAVRQRAKTLLQAAQMELKENMMKAFETSELIQQQAASGNLYLEFLKETSMSLGIYTLAAGATDPQQPHNEDEIYYVINGRGQIYVAGENRSVKVGSIIFVAAHDEHYFHQIEEELTLLVFFAPAET